jgi:hypothetical protein
MWMVILYWEGPGVESFGQIRVVVVFVEAPLLRKREQYTNYTKCRISLTLNYMYNVGECRALRGECEQAALSGVLGTRVEQH